MNFATIQGLLYSKVFWFNLCTLIVDVSGVLVGVIPPGTLTTIVAVANVGLRVLTTQPLSEKGPQ